MARQPFKPTAAEAKAIRNAEAWWAEIEPIHEHQRVSDLDQAASLLARNGIEAAVRGLSHFIFNPLSASNSQLFDVHLQALSDRLGAGHERELLALRSDAGPLQLSQTLVAMLDLLRALEQVAPSPGNTSAPSLVRFVFLAADAWYASQQKLPTGGGRFHKTIEDIALHPRIKHCTSKQVSAALKKWAISRSIASPKS